jgi:hypothetical protein
MKLRTKFSPAECRTRLVSATDLGGLSLSWNGPSDARKVLGDFHGATFRLHTARYYTNSFAPFFYGRMTACDNGTLIEGQFRMNPLARLLTVFWFAFVGIFAAAPLIVPMSKQPGTMVGPNTLYLALGCCLVLGIGLVVFGQWLGRGEKKVVLEFLKNSLEASSQDGIQ